MEHPDRRDPLWAEMDKGWTMSVELLTAVAVWGGLGWLLDRWLDTEPWFVATGIILGGVLGFYLVVKRSQQGTTSADAPTVADEDQRS